MAPDLAQQRLALRQEILARFDPNGAGKPGQLFGLPFGPQNAEIVVQPMPWEVTVSYGAGTAKGPAAILAASSQIDYMVPGINRPHTAGIAMLPPFEGLFEQGQVLRQQASRYIEWVEQGQPATEANLAAIPARADAAAEQLMQQLYQQTQHILQQGQVPVVLGGDHSTPLGAIKAVHEQYPQMGLLQIDAHADLRQAYEGFTYSHASIMYNVLQHTNLAQLVQVGVRDYCPEELDMVQTHRQQVQCYAFQELSARQFKGQTWAQQCAQIISHLPQQVYISFDIDGLDPALCPHTGTPVPGGLGFEQALFLIEMLVRQGHQIVGFDLVEVAPGPQGQEWDANVGARLLYRMAVLAAVSQQRLSFM